MIEARTAGLAAETQTATQPPYYLKGIVLATGESEVDPNVMSVVPPLPPKGVQMSELRIKAKGLDLTGTAYALNV